VNAVFVFKSPYLDGAENVFVVAAHNYASLNILYHYKFINFVPQRQDDRACYRGESTASQWAYNIFLTKILKAFYLFPLAGLKTEAGETAA